MQSGPAKTDPPGLRAVARPKLAFLDGLRGIAALYVVLHHARTLLWEGHSGYLSHPENYSFFARALVYVSAGLRWGHEAVIFFFVLSGFVIHLKYARRIAIDHSDTRFDLGPYLRRRARRLYPPLLAALLLTACLDALGTHFQLATHLGTTPYPQLNANIGRDHSMGTVFHNLVFIMQPVFGSNGPLWSLTYEWYFYLLYPAFFLITRRSWLSATVLLIGMSLLSFLPHWPSWSGWVQGVFRLMIVWWLGALLADRFAGRFSVPYSRVAWLSLGLLIIPTSIQFGGCRDILIGVGFVGVLASLFAMQQAGSSMAALSFLRPLGDMSYTLYVAHYPMLALMSGLLMRAYAGLLPQHFGWVCLGAMTCIIVAWALHFIVERPFTSPTNTPSTRASAAG